MARAFSLIALGLLFSLPSTLAIRTKVPGDEPSSSDNALAAGSSTKGHTGLGGYAEAKCGRLTVRGGLKVGESVKITANGWGKSDVDFVAEIVTDNSRGMIQMRESPPGEGPGLAGGSGGDGTAGSATDENGSMKEQPSISIVGVRIPGSENGDGESDKAAVLLYQEGETAPKEVPLDTPAGPTKAFMIFFGQTTPTEMTVRVLTWTPEGSGGDGSWHEALVVVGAGVTHRDVMVVVSDCSPHTLRVYGSSSADLVTASDETCQAAEPQLVALTSPQHGSSTVPEVSTETSASS